MSKKHLLIIGATLMLSLFGVFVFGKPAVSELEYTLKSPSYSYLSEPAKDFIREVYQDSGEIPLTEKNKVENVPYINPEFISFVELDQHEQSSAALIPEPYIIDYVAPTATPDGVLSQSYLGSSEDLPAAYDLRTVNTINGTKNFITPPKNQNPLGICWAFATVEQLESYLLTTDTNQTGYVAGTSKLFSARQLDYAASDSIINFANRDNYRNLTGGGNFMIASTLLVNGLGAVSPTNFNYSSGPWMATFVLGGTQYLTHYIGDNGEPYDRKIGNEWYNSAGQSYSAYLNRSNDLAHVQNYALSEYEVNHTISIYDSGDYDSDTLNNTIKNAVMQYGGAYVGTQSPQHACAAQNIDNAFIIRTVANECISEHSNSGHAMQIIGWDDNYEYNYCSGTTHTSVSGTSGNYTCSNGTLVTGNGAWLLRNSWGDFTGVTKDYGYVWLAYDSHKFEYGITADASAMDNRTWDNVYHDSFMYATSSSYDSKIAKTAPNAEKIEKFKFYAYAYNSDYYIYLFDNYDDWRAFRSPIATTSITSGAPGWYTIDLSDRNLVFDANHNTFYYAIWSPTGGHFWVQAVSIFTSNINTDELIIAPTNYDAVAAGTTTLTYLYDTRNIASNETLSVALLRLDTTQETGYSNLVDNDASISGNIVATNNANIIINLPDDLPTGIYKLIVSHDEANAGTLIQIGDYHAELNYSAAANGKVKLANSESQLQPSSFVSENVAPIIYDEVLKTYIENVPFGATAIPDAGYKFVGWLNSADYHDGSYNQEDIISNNSTLIVPTDVLGSYSSASFVAIFTEDIITVNFDYQIDYDNDNKNLYANISPSATQTINAQIGSPTPVVASIKSDYADYFSFLGWFKDNVKISDDLTLNLPKDTASNRYQEGNYIAKFAAVQKNLRIQIDDSNTDRGQITNAGDYGNFPLLQLETAWSTANQTATLNYLGADYIAIPADPSAQYTYTFDRWEKSVTATDFIISAKFNATLRNYLVTFDYDATKVISINPTSVDAPYNSTIAAPDIVLAGGYRIAGYFEDDSYQNVWDFQTRKLVKNTTIFIKIVANPITFQINPTVSYDEQTGFLTGFGEKLNAATFTELVQVNAPYYLNIPDQEFLGTGTIITVADPDDPDTILSELTIIIPGDPSGDGKITMLDYIAVRKHITQSSILSGVFSVAANYHDEDDKISMLDYIKIRKYITSKGAN